MIKINQKMTRQKGAILILSLILLLVLTFVAVSFGRVSSTELRSSRNYSERLSMLVMAEQALLEAESDIRELTSVSGLLPPFYYTSSITNPFDPKVWDTGVETAADKRTKYYIEVIPVAGGGLTTSTSVSEGGYGEDATLAPGTLTIFRTVVRAVSPDNTGVFMIESFYERTF
ncbi:MAG: PilX N-terminal [Gammaproteobacteria bacterium]|nr:PilX N-terminal [Gammaproteobacteria bacterium]